MKFYSFRKNSEIAIKKNQVITDGMSDTFVSDRRRSKAFFRLRDVDNGKIIVGHHPFELMHTGFFGTIVGNDDFVKILGLALN